MDGPDSSYSCFEIYIFWNVDRETGLGPPIQVEYFRSGGARILTFMLVGANAGISLCILGETDMTRGTASRRHVSSLRLLSFASKTRSTIAWANT
jgi:hypothetical protein